MLLARVADRIINRPLMIMPEKLALIASVLDGRIGIDAVGLGDEIPAELAKPVASRFVGEFDPVDPRDPRGMRKPYRTHNGIAIINVFGSLVNRGAWIGSYSGMTSYEGLKHQISTAASDDSVRAVVLDVDSPGGEAIGAFEVADAVRIARERKPIVGVVDGMACSAAYAIISACTAIVTTSSGVIGSVGVVMLHLDHSRRLDQIGLTPTLIHAGARKVDGNPYEPLSAEVRDELKADVDRFMSLFVRTVATNRPVLTEQVIRDTEARTYLGEDAVAIGFADEVGTFDDVIKHFSRIAPRHGSMARAT